MMSHDLHYSRQILSLKTFCSLQTAESKPASQRIHLLKYNERSETIGQRDVINGPDLSSTLAQKLSFRVFYAWPLKQQLTGQQWGPISTLKLNFYGWEVFNVLRKYGNLSIASGPWQPSKLRLLINMMRHDWKLPAQHLNRPKSEIEQRVKWFIDHTACIQFNSTSPFLIFRWNIMHWNRLL